MANIEHQFVNQIHPRLVLLTAFTTPENSRERRLYYSHLTFLDAGWALEIREQLYIYIAIETDVAKGSILLLRLPNSEKRLL